MLTDSHCHLTAPQFDGDRTDVLARARDVGVDRIVTIASNARDAETAISLAEATPGVWATAGIHPHEVARTNDGDLTRIRSLAEEGRAVAIGETGLDYFYDNAPRARQREYLRAHGEMAAALGLPLVVHSRNADQDVMAFLQELPDGVGGVLHCFTGGDDLLRLALDRGWYIGYGGIATFKSFADHGRLQAVPEDRLLVETDAPYLAPVPKRGKRNEPAFLTYSVGRIAEVRGVPSERVAQATGRNAARLFGLPDCEASL